GGASNLGTVFEMAAGSGAITTLASFNFFNGADPNGGLVEDSSGNLFGTTTQGGFADIPGGGGTAFEIAAGTGALTTLYSFDGCNGKLPSGRLVLHSSRTRCATAQGGAPGAGTVFEMAAGSRAVTTLAGFQGYNGENPLAGLVEDSSGNLFGTTNNGG